MKASCVSEGPVSLAGTHIQQLTATCSSSSGELSPKSDLQGPSHTCAHTETHRQLEIKEIFESLVPNNKTQGMFDPSLPGNVLEIYEYLIRDMIIEAKKLQSVEVGAFVFSQLDWLL